MYFNFWKSYVVLNDVIVWFLIEIVVMIWVLFDECYSICWYIGKFDLSYY